MLGGDFMKEFLYMLGMYTLFVLCVPILLIACIGYLLFVPFDIVRYHKMPYYRDFKNKYQFFITSRDVVKIYNRIVREQLPIEYIKNNDFEYFAKDGHVLLCGWGNEQFEQIDNEWFFVFEGKCNINIAMKEVLEDQKNDLKPEHKDLPAKFLFFYNDITDAERFEQAKECPYFHCVFSADEDI